MYSMSTQSTRERADWLVLILRFPGDTSLGAPEMSVKSAGEPGPRFCLVAHCPITLRLKITALFLPRMSTSTLPTDITLLPICAKSYPFRGQGMRSRLHPGSRRRPQSLAAAPATTSHLWFPEENWAWGRLLCSESALHGPETLG